MSAHPTRGFLCKLLVLSNGNSPESPYREFQMSIIELVAPYRSVELILRAVGAEIELLDLHRQAISVDTPPQRNARMAILQRALWLLRKLDQENVLNVEICEEGGSHESYQFEMAYRLCSPLPVACA